MKKSCIITGIVVAIGAVSAIMVGACSCSSSKKCMMKKANKAMKHINNMLCDFKCMFK